MFYVKLLKSSVLIFVVKTIYQRETQFWALNVMSRFSTCKLTVLLSFAFHCRDITLQPDLNHALHLLKSVGAVKLHHTGKWKQREPKFFFPRARKGGAKETSRNYVLLSTPLDVFPVFICLHAYFALTDLKSVLQASGIIEANLLSLTLVNFPQTKALRGQASTGFQKRRRKKPNARRKPKSANMARRKAPRTNLENTTTQRVKNQQLLLGGPDPDQRPSLPQVNIVLLAGEGGDPPCLFLNPTPGPTHPVDPDLEENPGLIQSPEASLDHEVGLCLDPGLGLILSLGQDHGQGTDQDPGHLLSPGRDQGLGTRPDPDLCPLEKGVFPDLQGRGRQPNPKWMQ